MDAIIISPVDSKGVQAAIIKADKAGIPVITVDVAAEGVPVVSHVATDNYAGGVEAGKLMGKLLHGKGTVAIISYPALQSVVARVDGFKKGLSDTPDIKIVAEQPGITRAEALTTAQNIMQANANLNGLFGFGDDAALAAVIAAKSAHNDNIKIIAGTRPGNTAIVDLAKRQVGNVGGYPYWSWYGFNSRVEWCACFVSWCYGQMGLSEPRFAACQSQGIPWFTSHGQWGARGYENIAPGDAIFFDWDLDGSADHVGLVIGRDESRVYTVEGNSGDACKIKSYALTYECIKGYGLMNWD